MIALKFIVGCCKTEAKSLIDPHLEKILGGLLVGHQIGRIVNYNNTKQTKRSADKLGTWISKLKNMSIIGGLVRLNLELQRLYLN